MLTSRLCSRLNDWSGTDTLIVDDGPKQAPLKVVKVSNAFFPSELKHDEDLAGDLERDLYEDAKKYGQVKKVTVFDLEKEGVATVRFTTEGAAKELAAALNGRKWNKWPLKTSLISVSNAAKFRKTEKTDADKVRFSQHCSNFEDANELCRSARSRRPSRSSRRTSKQAEIRGRWSMHMKSRACLLYHDPSRFKAFLAELDLLGRENRLLQEIPTRLWPCERENAGSAICFAAAITLAWLYYAAT